MRAVRLLKHLLGENRKTETNQPREVYIIHLSNTSTLHGCRKRGGGGGGGQRGHRPPSFLDWGGTGSTKKWYQHLQVITNHDYL